MDTTAQNQPVQTPPQQPVQAPTQPVQPPQTQVPPSIHKEQEVVASTLAQPEVVIAPSQPEIHIPPEIAKETGVEKVHEHPQLTLEDKKLGVQHAGDSVPMFPQAKIESVMTTAQAQSVWKSGNWKSAITWLAGIIMKNSKKDHK